MVGAAPGCGVLLAAGRTDVQVGPSATVSAHRSGPTLELDEEQYNFGRSEVGIGGRHAFVFTNSGDGALVLTRDRSTCGCCTCVCTVQLPEGAVAPGESAPVTLQWKSTLYVGPFRQTATILTNDPDRPAVTLSIAGRFTGPVGVVPSLLVFSSVRVGQAAMSEVRLYSYLQESLDITGFELSNPQNAEYFDVSWQRLSVEEVQEEGEARSGYLVRVAVQPGLPAGAFQQAILLKTNSKSVPRVEIPVQGRLVNDVSIAGRGWNAQTGVLTMGTVKRSEGVDWPLLIVVRGPHAKDVQLRAVRGVPGCLAVELEPTRYTADTGLSLTRMKIRVPSGSEPSSHLGGNEESQAESPFRPIHLCCPT